MSHRGVPIASIIQAGAAALLGATILAAPCHAQVVPTTTAQPTFGTNINLGLPLYGGYGGYGLSLYAGYPPSPFGNINQAVEIIATPPPGSQTAQPGQIQLPSMTGGGSQASAGGAAGAEVVVPDPTTAPCPRQAAARRRTPSTS